MKKYAFSILLLLLFIFSLSCVTRVYSPAPPAPPRGPIKIVHADISIFYDDLAPYGEWFMLEGFGWVWSPRGVSIGWRPYTNGYWIYSDYGLTWISYYDWGWAPFHYGRWLYDPYYGWVWMPGTNWAPAWVVWRYGNGWIGWAPLPPQVPWRAGIGIDLGGIDIDIIIKPFWWCFAEEQRVFYAGRKMHIVPQSRNVTVIKVTKHVTNYVIVDKKVVNKSIKVKDIEQAIKRSVPQYTIVDADSVRAARREVVRGQEVRVFRPELAEAPPGREPKKTEKPEMIKKAIPEQETLPGRPSKGESRPQEAAPSIEETERMMKRQENEKRLLEKQQEAKRAELERIQKKEMQTPPTRVTPEELKKRHDEERKALKDQIEREKELLKKKQEREKKAKEAGRKVQEKNKTDVTEERNKR